MVKKKIHSCAIRASKVAEFMKIDESFTKRISSKNINDLKDDADKNAFKSFESIDEFRQSFIDAYNQDECEDLWNARVYQNNYEEENVFVFACPDNQNLYFSVEFEDGAGVFLNYVFVDSECKHFEMFHHDDYNRWYEELDFSCTYNVPVNRQFGIDSANRWSLNNTYNHQDVVNIIQFLKVFVDTEGVASQLKSQNWYNKFKRKYGYTSKEFNNDIEGGFDGEVLNDLEWLQDAGEKLNTFFDKIGVKKNISIIHSEYMNIYSQKTSNGNFFNLSESFTRKIQGKTDSDMIEVADEKFGLVEQIKYLAEKYGRFIWENEDGTKEFLLDFMAMPTDYIHKNQEVFYKKDGCVVEDNYVCASLIYYKGKEESVVTTWIEIKEEDENNYISLGESAPFEGLFEDFEKSVQLKIVNNVLSHLEIKESFTRRISNVSSKDVLKDADIISLADKIKMFIGDCGVNVSEYNPYEKYYKVSSTELLFGYLINKIYIRLPYGYDLEYEFEDGTPVIVNWMKDGIEEVPELLKYEIEVEFYGSEKVDFSKLEKDEQQQVFKCIEQDYKEKDMKKYQRISFEKYFNF